MMTEFIFLTEPFIEIHCISADIAQTIKFYLGFLVSGDRWWEEDVPWLMFLQKWKQIGVIELNLNVILHK